MKKNLSYIVLIFSFINALHSQEIEKIEYYGGFPDTVTNIFFYNTEFDDFNSAILGGEYKILPFSFSTNRRSKGENFDIIGFPTQFSFVEGTKKFIMFKQTSNSAESNSIIEMLDYINSSANEYAPYYLKYGKDYEYGNHETSEFILFYASDKDGNLDIEYVYIVSDILQDGPLLHINDSVHGPFKLELINTENNEAYFSLRDNKIYYCSDKNGNYDIYEMEIDTITNILDEIKKKEPLKEAQIVKICSSGYNDKFPFAYFDLLVFASDRPGGYGGFDLYFSKWKNNKWTKPKNFGAKINSEFDEFRPIVKHFEKPKNDLLIFSSNRTGGKGGIDLYLVGIDKVKE